MRVFLWIACTILMPVLVAIAVFFGLFLTKPIPKDDWRYFE